jgi:hypothetical protein
MYVYISSTTVLVYKYRVQTYVQAFPLMRYDSTPTVLTCTVRAKARLGVFLDKY